MDATHRRYVFIETAIGAAINAALSFAFGLIVFGGSGAIPVFGAGGLIADSAPQTFMVTLMSVLVPTLLTRKRCRLGLIAPRPGPPVRAPGNAFVRAFALAAIAALLAVGAHAMLLSLGPPLWPATIALPAKILYGALLGAGVSNLSVRRALREASHAVTKP